MSLCCIYKYKYILTLIQFHLIKSSLMLEILEFKLLLFILFTIGSLGILKNKKNQVSSIVIKEIVSADKQAISKQSEKQFQNALKIIAVQKIVQENLEHFKAQEVKKSQEKQDVNQMQLKQKRIVKTSNKQQSIPFGGSKQIDIENQIKRFLHYKRSTKGAYIKNQYDQQNVIIYDRPYFEKPMFESSTKVFNNESILKQLGLNNQMVDQNQNQAEKEIKSDMIEEQNIISEEINIESINREQKELSPNQILIKHHSKALKKQIKTKIILKTEKKNHLLSQLKKNNNLIHKKQIKVKTKCEKSTNQFQNLDEKIKMAKHFIEMMENLSKQSKI